MGSQDVSWRESEKIKRKRAERQEGERAEHSPFSSAWSRRRYGDIVYNLGDLVKGLDDFVLDLPS